ncbi:hypothetical protein M1563_03025 [Patescibacteria group bacterium]|nr:hypothetical protein [Patescibacteria group bacterium]
MENKESRLFSVIDVSVPGICQPARIGSDAQTILRLRSYTKSLQTPDGLPQVRIVPDELAQRTIEIANGFLLHSPGWLLRGLALLADPEEQTINNFQTVLHPPSFLKRALERFHIRSVYPWDICPEDQLDLLYAAIPGLAGDNSIGSEEFGDCQSYHRDWGWWRKLIPHNKWRW